MTTLTLTQVSAHPDDRFAIGFAPLSLDEVYQLADAPGNGAVVIMSGTVRDRTDGQAVEYLEYQAYEPMAMRVFAAIGIEIRKQWTEANRPPSGQVKDRRNQRAGSCGVSPSG